MTTAAEDYKAASKAYAKANAAAAKKQKEEIRNANAQVKAANATLKRNGAETYTTKSKLNDDGNDLGEISIEAPKKQNTRTLSAPKKKPNNSVATSNSVASKKPSNSVASKRPTHNIPGQSSDSGAKAYWQKRKEQIRKAKQARGESTESMFDRFKNWLKEQGVGRKLPDTPVVTTRGVGQYR